MPDLEIEPETFRPIEINLYRQSIFFDFAVKYVAEHPEVKPDFEVTDEIVDDFRQFMKDKNFDYNTTLETSLEELQKTVASEGEDSLFDGLIDSLETLADMEKAQDFERSLDYIKNTIKREVVAAIAGQRGVYEEVVLKTDKAVKKAVEILSSQDEYTKLISKGQKKAEVN